MPYREADLGSVLAENVAEIRKRLGLSQAALAERMAAFGDTFHQTTVSRIEQGERQVTAEELFRLAAALDVPPSALVIRSDGGPVELGLRQAMAPDRMVAWMIGVDIALGHHPDGTSVGGDGSEISPEEWDARLEHFHQHAPARAIRFDDDCRELVGFALRAAAAAREVRRSGEGSVAGERLRSVLFAVRRIAERVDLDWVELFERAIYVRRGRS